MSFYRSEECFRRYEKVLAQALESYPNTVRFTSRRRQATTDAARCADAITSYTRTRWQTAYPIFATFDDKPLTAWTEGVGESAVVVVGPKSRDTIEVIETTGPGTGKFGSIRAFPQDHNHVLAILKLLNESVFVNLPIELPLEWLSLVERESPNLLNIAYRVETDHLLLF